MAPQPTRSARGHRMHHLFCMARPTTGSGSLPSCPTHPLPRYLLGTHSDPSVPAPGIFAPCCHHAQTAPRGALHPPWRHHGSWRRTFTAAATGPGRLGWMRAGWNGRTHTGWVNHNIGTAAARGVGWGSHSSWPLRHAMGRGGASFRPTHLGLVAPSIRLFESHTYGVYIDRRRWLVHPQVPATLNDDWGGGGWGGGRAVAAGLL